MTVAAVGDLALNRELLLRYEMMEGARAFKKLSLSQIASLPEFAVGWLSKHVNTEQEKNALCSSSLVANSGLMSHGTRVRDHFLIFTFSPLYL